MFRNIFLALSVVVVLAGQAWAAEAPEKATAQVKSGLYVTAAEAYGILQNNSKAILVDVRDPIEIMFTGWTNETDIHVPYMISDRRQQHPAKPVYAMKKNPDFVAEVSSRLEALKVRKDTPVIFMCRSGSTRSAPAADLFHELGYTQTFTVVDGFEGGKLADGNSKGVRARNGWRNSGLPWGYKLDFNKMYLASN